MSPETGTLSTRENIVTVCSKLVMAATPCCKRGVAAPLAGVKEREAKMFLDGEAEGALPVGDKALMPCTRPC